MYIGSGLVIQAPQGGEDIEITPFKGYWQQNVVAVRRVATAQVRPARSAGVWGFGG